MKSKNVNNRKKNKEKTIDEYTLYIDHVWLRLESDGKFVKNINIFIASGMCVCDECGTRENVYINTLNELKSTVFSLVCVCVL